MEFISKMDAVACNFNEPSDKINTTFILCLNQSITFNKIYLVNNGFTIKYYANKFIKNNTIVYIVLLCSRGISFARTVAIKMLDATFVACTNVDISIDKKWLKNALEVTHENSLVTCVFDRLFLNSNGLLPAWRMRFHKIQFSHLVPHEPTYFAPGHDVMFKKIY